MGGGPQVEDHSHVLKATVNYAILVQHDDIGSTFKSTICMGERNNRWVASLSDKPLFLSLPFTRLDTLATDAQVTTRYEKRTH